MRGYPQLISNFGLLSWQRPIPGRQPALIASERMVNMGQIWADKQISRSVTPDGPGQCGDCGIFTTCQGMSPCLVSVSAPLCRGDHSVVVGSDRVISEQASRQEGSHLWALLGDYLPIWLYGCYG